MKTKRNIAICLGSLLILMGMFASTAAAAEELGLSVSPENLVIGTNAKWISVVFHVEGTSYTAGNIDPTSITLTITDNANPVHTNSIAASAYDRTEITDADGDGTEELVLIYLASKMLSEDFTYETPGLNFNAAGKVSGNDFTASCIAKTTSIKGGNKGGEGNPGKGKGK